MDVPKRAFYLSGSGWFPACAALCVFPQTAIGVSFFCPSDSLHPLVRMLVTLFLILFYIVSLAFSSLGCMLLAAQTNDMGTLQVFGCPVPRPGLWTAYLLSFLAPWGTLVLAVVALS